MCHDLFVTTKSLPRTCVRGQLRANRSNQCEKAWWYTDVSQYSRLYSCRYNDVLDFQPTKRRQNAAASVHSRRQRSWHADLPRPAAHGLAALAAVKRALLQEMADLREPTQLGGQTVRCEYVQCECARCAYAGC